MGLIKNTIAWFSTRKLFGIFILLTLIICIFTLPIALSLAPWFYAANTSVQLKLNAPLDTEMELCWDQAQQECLPLVPNPGSNSQEASVWLTELPPRPVYHLTLIFRSPVEKAALQGLILQPQPFATGLLGATDIGASYQVTQLTPDVVTSQIEVNRQDDGWHLTGSEGGQLLLNEEIIPGPGRYLLWSTVAFLWSALVGTWLLIGGVCLPLFRRDKQAIAISTLGKATNNKILWLAFGIATTFHLFIVINSPVQFNQYDPIDYIRHANTLLEHGEYTSISRLPGYPVLLAICFWLWGGHLSTVAVLQTIMFDIAVLALALSLQHWLHPILRAIAILVAILSPVQVGYSAYILSESTFASFAIFSIAALFYHLSSRDFPAKVWLLVYAILATFAFLIRQNGVVLFAALLPIYIPKLWNLLWQPVSRQAKIKSVFLATTPYLMAGMVLVAVVFGWSTRNYFYYNYFQLSILTGHVPMQKLLFPGILDARGLLNIDCPIETGCSNDFGHSLYNYFIITRYQHPDWDVTFGSMRPAIDQILSSVSLTPTKQFQISQVMQAVGQNAEGLTPWPARIIGVLRAVWAAFGWRNLQGFFPIGSLDPVIYQQRQEVLHSTVGDKFVYDKRGESRLVSFYTKIASGYRWYLPLWLLALISGMVILWRSQPILACPLFVFMANGIFYVYLLRTAETRYIQVFDTFLIFQCVLGLSLLWNSKSTTINQFFQDTVSPKLRLLLSAKK